MFGHTPVYSGNISSVFGRCVYLQLLPRGFACDGAHIFFNNIWEGSRAKNFWSFLVFFCRREFSPVLIRDNGVKRYWFGWNYLHLLGNERDKHVHNLRLRLQGEMEQ